MAQVGNVPSTEFADLTGALGVGSINMMSLFLGLDATTNVFALVEQYAPSASWAIFVAVPILVASYVLGVLMIVAGGAFRRMLGHRAVVSAHVAMLRHPPLAEFVEAEYRQFRKKRDMLEGMIPTALLGAGAFVLEAQHLDVRHLGISLMIIALLGALACFAFLRILEREFQAFLASVAQPT